MRWFTALALLAAISTTINGEAPGSLRSEAALRQVRPPEEVGSVWAVFEHSAGLRFEARLLGDRMEQFELIPRGRITRNGRSAQMSDLRQGDDLVIALVSPMGRIASRIEAHSHLPERRTLTQQRSHGIHAAAFNH